MTLDTSNPIHRGLIFIASELDIPLTEYNIEALTWRLWHEPIWVQKIAQHEKPKLRLVVNRV